MAEPPAPAMSSAVATGACSRTTASTMAAPSWDWAPICWSSEPTSSAMTMPKGMDSRIRGSVVTRARNQHWSKNSVTGHALEGSLAQRLEGRGEHVARSPGPPWRSCRRRARPDRPGQGAEWRRTAAARVCRGGGPSRHGSVAGRCRAGTASCRCCRPLSANASPLLEASLMRYGRTCRFPRHSVMVKKREARENLAVDRAWSPLRAVWKPVAAGCFSASGVSADSLCNGMDSNPSLSQVGNPRFASDRRQWCTKLSRSSLSKGP